MCAEFSRFFGGPEGEIPEYNQTHDAEVYRLMFTSGVFSDVLNELEVVECDPAALAVRIKTGWAYVHGFWYHNTSLLTKSLSTADLDHPRIDRIVLRLDTTDDFEITIEVLKGTPVAEPEAPTLTQTDATYEISLAQILVGADVSSVNDANITDEREFAAIPNAVYLTLIQTLTNKRITKRVVTIASSATPTPNGDITDIYKITALAEAAEFAAPTGTPTNGQMLLIRIKDNGTARALSWNAIYRAGTDIALPTTTVVSKTMYVLFIYNSADIKWDLVDYIDNI